MQSCFVLMSPLSLVKKHFLFSRSIDFQCGPVSTHSKSFVRKSEGLLKIYNS